MDAFYQHAGKIPNWSVQQVCQYAHLLLPLPGSPLPRGNTAVLHETFVPFAVLDGRRIPNNRCNRIGLCRQWTATGE